MDVLMACAELAPVVKASDLADDVAALARTVSRLDHRVTVVLPKYPQTEEAGLMLARRLTPLRFDVGGETWSATQFDTRLGSRVELTLIDLPGDVLDGGSVYGEDEGRRFGLFARAVEALVRAQHGAGTGPDVVHAHDWSTALVIHLLRDLDVRRVLTIHDARHQGRFPKALAESIGLEASALGGGVEGDDIGFLEAGLVAADRIVVVSETYAEHLATAEGGAGLDRVFTARADAVHGVLHGVDHSHWSPSTDPHLAARYDAEAVANKGRCKAALLQELDFSLSPERPLLVFCGPLDASSGVDLVARALPDLVRSGARVVIGGAGDAALEGALDDATAGFDDDAAFLGAVSTPLAHRLLAAADAILVPARHAPSGLACQRGQRYGAVPIARAIPGIADVVVDCDAALDTGTGFLFHEDESRALVGAVGRALGAMQRPGWGRLRRRVMRLDRSGEMAGRRYVQLYR
ncbi:MAG: glycogen/starch synthase [Myxococcota bacterium]